MLRAERNSGFPRLFSLNQQVSKTRNSLINQAFPRFFYSDIFSKAPFFPYIFSCLPHDFNCWFCPVFSSPHLCFSMNRITTIISMEFFVKGCKKAEKPCGCKSERGLGKVRRAIRLYLRGTSVFDICEQNNWKYLFRLKEAGSKALPLNFWSFNHPKKRRRKRICFGPMISHTVTEA